MKEKIAVIVLAAGRGSRLNCSNSSKVMRKLAGKPMIAYTAKLLQNLGFKKEQVYLVVGFGKEEIIKFLGSGYSYVHQKKLLGTADAVKQAVKKFPENYDQVLILQADDSAFYPSNEVERLIHDHINKQHHLSFLTVEKSQPTVGRVLRDRFGHLTKIVEPKNATPKQLQVKEINAAVYVVKGLYAKEYLPKIKPNPVTKEYHLPDLINLGLKNQKIIVPIKMSNNNYFQGINTKEELLKADELMKKKLAKK